MEDGDLPRGMVLWSLSGDQGDEWHSASILASYASTLNASFAFEYTRGDGWAGDAAIDEVEDDQHREKTEVEGPVDLRAHEMTIVV